MGEKALLATTAAMLAQAVHRPGARRGGRRALSRERGVRRREDVSAQVGCGRAGEADRGREGRLDEAEGLAAEAVRLAERTDFLNLHADALMDLGEVLRRGGRADDAGAATDARSSCTGAKATSCRRSAPPRPARPSERQPPFAWATKPRTSAAGSE